MKKYSAKSIMLYLYLSILIIILIVLVYIFVSFFINFHNAQNFIGWLSFIASSSGIIYFFYKVAHVIKRSIVVYDNKIQVQEDIGGKDIKLQYALDVKFDDIQSIGITVDSNNSRNQYMRFVITPMPNVILHLKNGKSARINVYYYSKKQTIEIIDYIIGKKKLIDATFENKSGQELIDGLKNVKI